jgi:hypothetical protein
MGMKGVIRSSLKPVISRMKAVDNDISMTVDEYGSTAHCHCCFRKKCAYNAIEETTSYKESRVRSCAIIQIARKEHRITPPLTEMQTWPGTLN